MASSSVSITDSLSFTKSVINSSIWSFVTFGIQITCVTSSVANCHFVFILSETLGKTTVMAPSFDHASTPFLMSSLLQ